MIFLTVGGQLPFDRLVRLVDEWAGSRNRRDVVAQIASSVFEPRHLETHALLKPAVFRDLTLQADAIVAHAGVGTILTALELGKPLLVLPRLAKFGEHRNDHQVETARRFAEAGLVLAAFEDGELATRLDELEDWQPSAQIGAVAPAELIRRIREAAIGESQRPTSDVERS